MAIVTSSRPSSGGGGGGSGEQQRWKRDELDQTAAWSSGGLVIPLTSVPTDADAITVWSQGLVLHPDDYTVLNTPSRIQINFAADPSTDTENGVWAFFVQYPYIL